jgi:hypothetical protein
MLDKDIECLHCGSLIRITLVALGVRDERSCFDCPVCKNTLFSWDQANVYDIIGIVRLGSRKNAPGDPN